MMSYKKITFWKRIQVHAILILIVVLLVNTTLSSFALRIIDMTGIDFGLIGWFLSNFMGVIISTTLIATFLNYYVLKPIRKMEKSIYAFEQGNHDVRFNTKNFNEIGVLGSRLNTLFSKIQNHQETQQHQIDYIEEKSENISADMNQLTEDITGLNNYFNEISNGAVEQLSTFEETSAITDNMNSQFQSIAATIDELTRSFNQMRTQTDQGITQVSESSKAMETIAKTSDDTKVIVNQLTEEIEKIKEIVTLINDISEQTNLLALNASIEAARAGEHGKGFSIVADEVRKLAERSVDATDRIASTVDHILSGVGNVSNQTETQADHIASESEKILAINSGFEEFAKTIAENIKIMDDINQHTQDVSQSSVEIASAMEQATSKSEDTTEHVTKMSEFIDDQQNKTENIQQQVKDLKKAFD
ncbi:methyl-accepting chemotaxis protein [Pelagirhabdus alkalitolerans]|uniref:Methyl-accepting chemotaxis protein n=2 Tax=Pelagirhabdus alkalitolerans TaxID=1612202 RepID=A0A1G6IT41_9BACI|nr:methyl-accepting chemotaxis protein [Pelagirhabdus alkalitolerans]